MNAADREKFAIGAKVAPVEGATIRPIPNTGPFRHRIGSGMAVRVAIPWTGVWDEFVAYAALIDLDITEFAPGPNGTLAIPNRLLGKLESGRTSLCRGGWLGYPEGRSTLWTWAPDIFRYDYLGGPKPEGYGERETSEYGLGASSDALGGGGSDKVGKLDLARFQALLDLRITE